jgi:hypothetical protein
MSILSSDPFLLARFTFHAWGERLKALVRVLSRLFQRSSNSHVLSKFTDPPDYSPFYDLGRGGNRESCAGGFEKTFIHIP